MLNRMNVERSLLLHWQWTSDERSESIAVCKISDIASSQHQLAGNRGVWRYATESRIFHVMECHLEPVYSTSRPRLFSRFVVANTNETLYWFFFKWNFLWKFCWKSLKQKLLRPTVFELISILQTLLCHTFMENDEKTPVWQFLLLFFCSIIIKIRSCYNLLQLGL